MALSGIESNYNAYGSAYAAQKTAAEKAAGKESNVTTSGVENFDSGQNTDGTD